MTKKQPVTAKELRKVFAYMNEHFFHDKLPNPAKIEFIETGDKDGFTKTDANGYAIYLHKGLTYYPNLAVIVLIHEMAHIGQWTTNTLPGGHGMIFNAEIVRLFNAGAYEGLL